MMDDVERIAKGLTGAQRRLLAAIPSCGQEASDFWNGEYRNHTKGLQTLRVLTRKRLAGIFGELTDKGHAVRTYLQENPDNA